MLRRAGAGIAMLAAIAVWLWALPALLTRDGFFVGDGDACRHAAYRDPVTGQPRPAPSTRIAVREHCMVTAYGGRP